MGKQIHIKKVEELLEKSPVVDFRSIQRIVRSKKAHSVYAKLMVSKLAGQGKLKRLCKGFYSKHDEISLAVFCFQPAYLGLQSALSFHQLWEQESIPVIITSTKARPGVRKVLGNNVLIRRIDKKYMFGFNYYDDGGFFLPYSSIEKTLIDLVEFNQNIPGEVMEKIMKSIDMPKLKKYLARYSGRIKKKVYALLEKQVTTTIKTNLK